jgi:hypothetical protein
MEKINKEQFNTSLESLKKTKPSSSDAASIKASILSSLPGRVPVAPLIIPSPYLKNIRRPIFATVAGALLLAGSLSYAANFTIPGDLLYAIKTHINEPVILALKSDEREKAEYQLELAKKRMIEMEELYKQNGIDVQSNTEVASELFNKHINAAIQLGSSSEFSPEERATLEFDIKSEQDSYRQSAKIKINLGASTSLDIKKDSSVAIPVKNPPESILPSRNSPSVESASSTSLHTEEESAVHFSGGVQQLPGLRK